MQRRVLTGEHAHNDASNRITDPCVAYVDNLTVMCTIAMCGIQEDVLVTTTSLEGSGYTKTAQMVSPAAPGICHV